MDVSSRWAYLVIPPSHLFRISKNQAEPAEMKNFQNSRHIREGISNPVTPLEAEWAGMTAEWKWFIYWIRAAFERQSKDSDIWIAFQLNSCNIEIYSGSNRNAFEVHSGSFEAHSGHSGRIWSGLPFRFSFRGDQNVSNVVELVGMPS